jgi:hypothetical protein
MTEEQSPIHSNDQRLRTRLHELRAKAWIGQVMTVSMLDTPYKLDQKFGGGQRKWKAYQAGQMPNERTVQAVEDAHPGTRDWIERGPDDLALWPALGHRDIDVLNAIANQSSRIDGHIARLRLDAARDLIEVFYPPPMKLDVEGSFQPDLRWPPVWFNESDMDGDAYVIGLQALRLELQQMNILPSALCDEVANYMYSLLQPYRLNAYRKKFEEFYDFVMDTRFTFAAGQNDHEEMLYQTARMKSIGNKGSRTDVQ